MNFNEDNTTTFNGLYRGIVVNNGYQSSGEKQTEKNLIDSFETGRVQIRIPSMHSNDIKDEDLPWAEINESFLFGGFSNEGIGINHILSINMMVWIMFEDGDPNKPIIIGSIKGKNDINADVKSNSNCIIIETPFGLKITIDGTTDEHSYTWIDPNNNTYTINKDGIHIIDVNENDITCDSNGIIIQDTNGKKITLSSSGIELKSSGSTEKMVLGEKLNDCLEKIVTAMDALLTVLQTSTYIAPAIPASPVPLVVISAPYEAAKQAVNAAKSLILSSSNKND
jgi:hypothetical protein